MAMTDLSEITNFIQIHPDIGTSGQPTVVQFSAIAAANYRSVINLAMPDSDHALADEGNIVATLGMRYVHLPVPFDDPNLDHLRAFVGVMEALSDAPIWVHCVVNARVSAFMFHYLHQVRGLPATQSRSWLLDKWEPQMAPEWQRFMSLDATKIRPKPSTAGAI